MGLLSVPKKYNPPGNGKRDMEYPIFATKQEMGLLKARGGSGKMTKHGIRSFGLGDKGNAVGSAGGSNYSGDGMGGQVNMDGVGMGGDKVLRQIDGRWTAVSRDVGAQIDAGGSIGTVRQKPAPVQYAPAAAPVQQTITAPISLPANFMGPMGSVAGPIGPQIGGTSPAAISAAINGSGTSSAWGGSNPTTNQTATLGSGTSTAWGGGGSSSPTVNAVSPLGMGGSRGSWSSPASPSPNSMPGNSNTGLNYGPGTQKSYPNSMPGNSNAGLNYGPGTQSTPQGSGTSTAWGNQATAPAAQPSATSTVWGGAALPAEKTAITSMLAEAQRRAAANRLREQYSQYQSPPGSPMAPGSLDRYADMTTGGKFGVGSTQAGMTPEATPDRAYNVGVMDAPRLSADPTNGISAYPGAGVPNVPTGYAADMGRYGPAGQVGPVLNKITDRLPMGPGKITDRLTPDMSAPLGSRLGSPAPGYTYAEQRPAQVNRFAPPPSEVSADLWSRVGQLTAAMKRPAESEVGVPAGLGPTYGPETPKGPEGWQQGDVSIDPTAGPGETVLDYAKEIAMNTPIARAATGIMNVLDRLSGGPAYRDDVSLGTDESGRRTDRAPSGGGFSTSPGNFGPGGQDRRGATQNPGQRERPQDRIPEADRDFISTLPQSEQDRLYQLKRRDPRAFWEELKKLRAAPPTGGGGTTPGTTGPFQWYYPQYQSTWAGLPVGLGGTYGRA